MSNAPNGEARDEAGPGGARDLFLPARVVVAAAFVVMLLVTLAQIVFRYGLDRPLLWSEELARLLIVWITFIGGAVVSWDGRHLNVDVVFAKLGLRARAVLRLVNAAIAVAFLAVLAWTSIRIVRLENFHSLSALPLPAGVVRLAATVGGTLMIAAILMRLTYRRLLKRRGDAGASIDDPM